MVAAILAVITALVGMVSGIIGGDNAEYANRMAIYEGNIDRSHQKELSYYNIFKTQQMAIAVILLIGVLAAVLIIWQNNRSK